MTDDPYQITERGDPRDRIHNQRPLFDVDRTTTKVCPVVDCPAIRPPGKDRTLDCVIDGARLMGMDAGTRPKGCLNAHDPAHAPFPEGF